jgi:hypothetical protein
MKVRQLTAEELNQLMSDILKLIHGDEKLLPKINISNESGSPYIEISRYGYEYVCNERGREFFRLLPIDIKELLFLVFKDVTRKMASDYELRHRSPNEDIRRKLFNKHVELLGILNAEWAIRKNNDYLQILKSFPFRDNL